MNKAKAVVLYIFTIISLSILSSSSPAQPKIELVEPVWDLGRVAKGEVVDKIIKIKNAGSDRLVIKKVRSSCECIALEILKKEAEENEFVEIRAVFNTTKGLKDRFVKYIYVQSNDPNSPVIRISVRGGLVRENIGQRGNDEYMDVPRVPDSEEVGKIGISLFYSPGCRGCRMIKDVFLVDLQKRFRDALKIDFYDITSLENYLKLMEFEERYGVTENDPVIIFAGDRYFSGKKSILKELEPYVKVMVRKSPPQPIPLRPTIYVGTTGERGAKDAKGGLVAKFRSFSPLVIISAGFIDGINPCAFVTIVFLISFLVFVQKKKREILLIGLVFSSSVFLTYLFLGLGIYQILQKLETISVASDIIYFLAIGIVFILAFYSIYDLLVYLRFKTSKGMKLQLPQLIKKKIHDVIRNNLGTKGLIFTVLLTGFLVSLLESVCTGQVYFPTLVFMSRVSMLRSRSLWYLILYNLAFVTPLLGVMFLAFLGVSSEKFVSFSRRNTFIAKLLLAILFIALGILLIVTF